jgi:hypothetical protein
MHWILSMILVVALSLGGCAAVTTSVPDVGVTNISENIYEIMDVDYRGIFGSEASLISGNVGKAETFASTHNKIAVPILARIHRVGMMGDWAWFYYKFSLADPDSSEANIKFEDIVVERDARLSEEFYQNRHKEGASNVYDDLLKLDVLKKKGIISDSEFQQQKAKILNK